MEYNLSNLKRHTSAYKYFYNNNIVFVTSAKVGSRFMKAVSEKLSYANYTIPLNEKLEEFILDPFSFNSIEESISAFYQNLFKGKKTIFLVRNPFSRFISGLTTNFNNIDTRLVEYGEDGKDFLRSYFSSYISEKQLEDGIEIFKHNYLNFIKYKEDVYLKNIIRDNVLTQAIHKDSHVEYHHYLVYQYMKSLKDMGAELYWLDIKNLDLYIKSKELAEWGYDDEMEFFKKTESKSFVYGYMKERLETWKSEIKELSLYFELEFDYYNKIQSEYEVLL